MIPAYDASSRKEIRRAEKAARQSEVARAEFIRSSLSTSHGRTWFHDFLSAAHIFATTFAPEPTIAAFQEGERNLGLRVFADIMGACPELYVLMMQEAQQKEILNARREPEPDPDGTDPGSEHSGSEDADG